VLSNLPVKVDSSEIEEMLRTADVNGDGSISYEEFRDKIRQI
jgi:Ca2+-binding EF-hand superfamily protein